MSLKSKRICKCCGKEYEYCPHCGSKSDELWRNLTDTKECLEVFNIVAAYNLGRVPAERVKKVLKDNNITDYSKFKPDIVAALDKACKPVELPKAEPKIEPKLENEVAPIVPEEKKEEPVIEPQVVEEPVAPVLELPEEETSTEPLVELQNKVAPRKNRNGKKKYRKRNADIGL